MASYYDYYDYGPACYDPPEPNYYDSEPSYDPEPEYYDPEPSYDDDTFYDNQDHADAPTEEIYEDYGHGSDADIPVYHEGGYYAEEDGDVGVMSVDCDGLRYEADYPVLGDEEYMLEDEQSPVEDKFAYTAHTEALCTFADTVSWADKLLRGPPSGVCVAMWESEMHTWRERIIAGTAPESPFQLTDTEPAPPHVPWMADHLDAMQYALQQGHVPENERAQYAQTLAEWRVDQLADERTQAEGWIWDEEREDYWHPDHGYTADDPELADDEDCVEGQLESIIPPTTSLPLRSRCCPRSHRVCRIPVDLPVAYDVEANFLEDAFHQAFNILSMRAIPSAPRRARPPSTTRKHPIHMLVPPPMSTRRSVCSQPHVVQRSNSVRSKGKTRRVHPRRTRSCPYFTREAPPHLPRPPDVSTPSVAAVPAGDPVPQRKVVPPYIAGAAVAVSPPPKSAVRARSCSLPQWSAPCRLPYPRHTSRRYHTSRIPIRRAQTQCAPPNCQERQGLRFARGPAPLFGGGRGGAP
ncbi:hypothetical protein B0H10DRAFT_1940409 [Mycena sp. CBHHK59/15]|nr:hypothetical protein B0H10DRAFT_1940409 [Mycena sp. CBHHK59/15]